MKIGSFDFLNTDEVYVCAEIGINHNGSMESARELIDVAVHCGCNGVKFQKRTPDLCVPEHQKNIQRETPWGLITYLEYKNKIEFSVEQMKELSAYCQEKGIDWFVSCWDEPSLDEMLTLNPVALKLPSAFLTDEKLLKLHLDSGVPLIWSTGMSTEEEVITAYETIDGVPNVMCHCNSSYPAAIDQLNLNYLKVMMQKFPNSIIGYSGHEVGLLPSLLAVALGARFIERHITLDRALWGTDQAASVEPQGLERLVRDIRRVNVCLGDPEKVLFDSELSARKKLRGN